MLAAFAGPFPLSNLVLLPVDENGNGDLLDHYLGKSSPDWAGSFGLSATLLKNLELSSLFEYKAGNYTITNLTFAFRNSNATIGRNSAAAARVESIMLNPTSTAQQFDLFLPLEIRSFEIDEGTDAPIVECLQRLLERASFRAPLVETKIAHGLE